MRYIAGDIPLRGTISKDQTTQQYYEHSSGQRTNTDLVLIDSLSKQYPDLPLTVIPISRPGFSCNLLIWADLGHATATPVVDSTNSFAQWRCYVPPARRIDGGTGIVGNELVYGKFLYKYKDYEFVLYVADGRDGFDSYPKVMNQYLLGKAPQEIVDELIRDASEYSIELHNEIWVFDGGFWDKSYELYESVENASWDDIILDEEMKNAIQDDVLRFFSSRERYQKLRVPWKRGTIYYGPPGNGKTVSIKAMMHTLYHLKDPIPTLYVRSLSSFAGPEYSISQIFAKARQTAPCLLVFEDLDSVVTDEVRSYFLNEVDGLRTNEGVLMIGSTNHLDRLDPGISKRPSRFDRKYEFPKPVFEERVKYCEYWRKKLEDNKDVEFPQKLCSAIAKITKEFSFAYIQEAFVASLLAIAAQENDVDSCESDDLEDLILWREMKKQVKLLRGEM